MNIFKLVRKKGLLSSLKKIKRRIFINDVDIMGMIARLGTSDYLQKYKYVLYKPQNIINSHSVNSFSDKIWVCWLQGIDNAPFLVKKCIEIIQYYHQEDVILLDSNNIAKYIEIPEYIIRKWQKGMIPNAHYSDVLRILLLAQHGGVWIDSTTFLFDKIPDYIRYADLFCFKSRLLAKSLASNWFIVAKPNNPVILKMKDLLLEYWKEENKLVSYSIFHVFFTMIVTEDEEGKLLWKKVPTFVDMNCKILQDELFDDFNEVRLRQIKQISSIQKLSYKFPQECFQMKNTFYDVLLNQPADLRGCNLGSVC